jgi:tetratricopeptide (TPR) repeat protein
MLGRSYAFALIVIGQLLPLGVASAQLGPAQVHSPAESSAVAPDANEAQANETSAVAPDANEAQANETGAVAPDANKAQAKAVLSRAEALFEAGNYDAALSEYARAYELLAGHPEQTLVLNNIAVCHERMFRYDLALQFYERYLAESDADAADRREVTAAVRTLRGLLATLEITSNVPAEIWVDDRRFGHAPDQVLLPAGRHVIELRATLHENVRREISISARETQQLAFVLPRLSDYRGLERGYFFASAGITAAVLITAGVFGTQALAAHDKGRAHAALAMQFSTPELESDRERVRRWATATDLALGGAVLFGATSLLLFFLTDWSSGDAERSRVALRPSFDAGTRGMTLTIDLP